MSVEELETVVSRLSLMLRLNFGYTTWNCPQHDEIMNITLPLDQMTTAEKLRVMKSLWADLSRVEPEFESPGWHEAVLTEREERIQSGLEKFMDWEAAKKELRDRIT